MPYFHIPHRTQWRPSGALRVRRELLPLLECAVDARAPNSPFELKTGRPITKGSSVTTSDPYLYGTRSRFPGNNVNSFWSLTINAIGTGDFSIVLGDVRYNTYATDSLQGYCLDFNAQSSGGPAFTHSSFTTSLCWYDGGSINNAAVTAPGGNVSAISWRRKSSNIVASHGLTLGTAPIYTPQNITGTTLNIGGFKALASASLHPNFSLGYLLLARVNIDDTLLRDIAKDPYGAVFIVYPHRIFFGTGGGTTVDGTATITPSPQTVTGSVAVAVASTATITPSAQTLTASGGVAVSATASITLAAQTLTASGGVAVGATASVTPSAQTVTASGTVVSGVEGTANITPSAQTVTANGTIHVAATATITPSAQTTTANGTVDVAATATITPAAQTLSATGVVVSSVLGTASITPAAQTATANGTVAILATAAVTPAAQTLSATGAVSFGAVTGTANIFVDAQTLVAQANIIVLGVATITPALQTLTASGAVGSTQIGWLEGEATVMVDGDCESYAIGHMTGSTAETGMTPTGIANAVWSRIIEAGFSAEGILRLLAAHAAGDASGLEGATTEFMSLDGFKPRITGSVAAGVRVVTDRDVT